MSIRRGIWAAFFVLAIALTVVITRSSEEVAVQHNAPSDWSAGWDAALSAVGKENFYSRNAAERVQKRYFSCIGGGGSWSAKMAACEY